MRFCLAAAIALIAVSLRAGNAPSNDADASSPQQVFDSMRESFKADKAKGVHARYQ